VILAHKRQRETSSFSVFELCDRGFLGFENANLDSQAYLGWDQGDADEGSRVTLSSWSHSIDEHTEMKIIETA
jgi:hypothetical protein